MVRKVRPACMPTNERKIEGVYLYRRGLMNLVKTLRGDERIHMGIRPYGFHAGNATAIAVYPYLLCKYFALQKRVPRFSIFISINDYEQDCPDGPDIIRYPFNFYPKYTSLQHTPDDRECCGSIVEHWQPVLERILVKLFSEFPSVQVRFVRNSTLRDNPDFRSLLLRTLREPREQAAIMKKHSGKEVLPHPVCYAGAVCPKCVSARGETRVLTDDRVRLSCSACGLVTTGSYDNFHYWWHHKAMLTARLKIFNIDLTISGADHFSEGDVGTRSEFIEKFVPGFVVPKMLFSPLLLSFDGRKMSKSRDNTYFADIRKLIAFMETTDASEVQVTKDLVLIDAHEKNYYRHL